MSIRRFIINLSNPSADTTAPGYASSEIGDVDTTTLEVVFNETVQATDFTDGVTIKVNTVSQTITSGTLQGDGITVYYVIPACDVNDAITWEYSAAGGNILDAAGNALGDVAAQTATNYIGSQFYFQDLNSSGHFAHL
jgi:hypothetical protein